MKPQEALKLLENIKKDAPEKLVAACNTIAMEAPVWADQSLQRDKKLWDEMGKRNQVLLERVDKLEDALGKVIRVLHSMVKPGAQAEAANTDVAGAQQAQPPVGRPAGSNGSNGNGHRAASNGNGSSNGNGRTHMHPDGRPFSAEEEAIEAQMDAASEGMAPHPGGGA